MAFGESVSLQNGIAPAMWRGGARRTWRRKLALHRHCDAAAGRFGAWKPRTRRLHARERAHDLVGKRRDLLGRHVDVQRHVLRGRRHPAVSRMEQLLEVVDALAVVVEELEGGANWLT